MRGETVRRTAGKEGDANRKSRLQRRRRMSFSSTDQIATAEWKGGRVAVRKGPGWGLHGELGATRRTQHKTHTQREGGRVGERKHPDEKGFQSQKSLAVKSRKM